MADTIQSVFDLPDVSFTDNDTLEDMLQRLISNYESKYEEVTGRSISLAPADPIRILLHAVAMDLFQIEQYVERAGRQDLLKYSYGDFLDNLAGNRSVVRQQASAATTKLRFTISEAKAYAIGVPVGTRATNGDGIYFETVGYDEIPAGALYIDIDAQCTVEGIEGNDFLPGQINQLVDLVAYVESVANVTTTGGGTDLETDDSLAERVFLAPSSYSVAGPDDAYVYWVKTYNSDIGSVKPTSPEPCQVVIYILMADGSIPGTEVVEGLEEYLQDSNIRPLTDLVSVQTPEVVTFDISLTYYINRSDSASATTIQSEVDAAIKDYITWQTTEIGKDINPSELISRVRQAGAKRVIVNSPEFTVIKDAEVAQCSSSTPIYGGLEDD